MVLADGGAFFVENPWLASQTHGVVIHNPTLTEQGEYKIVPRPDLTKVLETAKTESQKRVDFVTLAHECVPLDQIRGGMIRRFVKFCQDFKVVSSLAVDPTLSRPEMVHRTPSSPLGAMAVLSSPQLDEYFKAFRAYHGGNKKMEDGWQKVIVRDVVAFAKTLGHDVEAAAFTETLGILREKYKQSGTCLFFVEANNNLFCSIYHMAGFAFTSLPPFGSKG